MGNSPVVHTSEWGQTIKPPVWEGGRDQNKSPLQVYFITWVLGNRPTHPPSNHYGSALRRSIEEWLFLNPSSQPPMLPDDVLLLGNPELENCFCLFPVNLELIVLVLEQVFVCLLFVSIYNVLGAHTECPLIIINSY